MVTRSKSLMTRLVQLKAGSSTDNHPTASGSPDGSESLALALARHLRSGRRFRRRRCRPRRRVISPSLGRRLSAFRDAGPVRLFELVELVVQVVEVGPVRVDCLHGVVDQLPQLPLRLLGGVELCGRQTGFVLVVATALPRPGHVALPSSPFRDRRRPPA